MKIALLLTAMGLIATTSCSTTNAPPPVKGFQAFDSPRDFDPPGRVYRVDSEGKTFGVGQVNLAPRTGVEYTKAWQSTATWSFGTVLSTAGVAQQELPASLTATLGRSNDVHLVATRSTREWLDDDDYPEDRAQELLKRVGYREHNNYYIIRATISTTNLDVTVGKKWFGELQLPAQILQLLTASNHLNFETSTSYSLKGSFEKPMRVWYLSTPLNPKPRLGNDPSSVPSLKLGPPATRSQFHLPAERLPDVP